MNTKDRIIFESMKLFSMKGFLSTSISDILTASGISKGGFYNHFKNKEELFASVLTEARRIWRKKTLSGLDKIDKPIAKAQRLLENYRDKYLMDSADFPGGCIFITLSVELDDQLPHLSSGIHNGFKNLKAMIQRLLDQAKASGELRDDVSTEAVSEIIFSGMLGASVMYGLGKSSVNLNKAIQALLDYMDAAKR
jgi:TetR/AcrR family transcriptional repressor of nem operon